MSIFCPKTKVKEEIELHTEELNKLFNVLPATPEIFWGTWEQPKMENKFRI